MEPIYTKVNDTTLQVVKSETKEESNDYTAGLLETTGIRHS